ncbi:MAG: SWIM zinc finger family protein [Defluviitaleaceae bacterium]|nr:SWIM zinc finger family protein [Defluviitaleaceae bacterium]
MRSFPYQSQLTQGSLALSIAPALTPSGIITSPNFYRGYALHPQVLARGLLVLGDIVTTRYFKYTPEALRDPILTAQGDRLRAECFSACNGVYARMDLLQSGFDGKIDYGTTNVDIGTELRAALTKVKQGEKLHLNVGDDGLRIAHYAKTSDNIIKMEGVVHERPVKMPDRWVRALGNAAEIHRGMKPILTLKGPQAQSFIAALPPATSKSQPGWLTPTRTGVKLMPRPSKDAAFIPGPHRLSALKRVMTNISQITFYMPEDNEPGPSLIEATLPGARITISLTAEAWQGYSGEGALLTSLAQGELLEDAEFISSMLSFEAAVNQSEIARKWNMSDDRLHSALAYLAVSGKLGYDTHDNAYFHRELPDDPNRVLKDNPRLVAARKLVSTVMPTGDNKWLVNSGGTDYMVHDEKCTCTWYLNHQNKRGPCKHILAVQLRTGGESK